MSVANKIIIYTDGSSLGNPGPGGYGAAICLSNAKNANTPCESCEKIPS